ncbi:MAG: pantoate--beta-alanine ligase [Parvularcula sp.]
MILAPFREKSQTIGFVPTMGALHAGHLSLIEAARRHADRVLVSIFVNPRQFGPTEDFSTYPRTAEEDLRACADAGADAVFMPTTETIYPDGYQTVVSVPRLADCLDGTSRPGFFDGIATVVTKLFNLTRPDVAVFGEKDFQQLLIIRQMVRDLNMPVQVIGAPIVREADGLAMSSRNRYLSEEERDIAANLNLVMKAALVALRDGAPTEVVLTGAIESLQAVGLAPVDYFELRQLPDLSPAAHGPLPERQWATTRLFAAVALGKTRLIDNMAV